MMRRLTRRLRNLLTALSLLLSATVAACGYDLRATPGKCPECGTIPAASIAASTDSGLNPRNG